MTGGDLGNDPADGTSPPPDDAPTADGPPAPGPGARPAERKSVFDPTPPELPRSDAAVPPPLGEAIRQPTRGASTWYRTDQDRFRSVRRRANPWYRRLARGVIGLCVLAALGVGLYFGAREVQDYLDRDRLPGPGVDIPTYRATSFQVQSSPPAPDLDGTITLDAGSGAFEFVGAGTGPQSGVQIVSPDGAQVYIRVGEEDWRVAGPGDAVVNAVRTGIDYLNEADTADDVLTNRLRQGFVELDERATEGVDENELTRYEMTIDTDAFSEAYPLQWSAFQRDAIPGADDDAALAVTIWLDVDDVLVRLRAGNDPPFWTWERLTYSDEPFRPFDPATTLLDATTDGTDGSTEDPAESGEGADS